MKRPDFLTDLRRRKKLSLVEPSEEIKEAYLQKSATSLISAKTLADIGNLGDAVALAYYSMYYSLLALLFRIGVKCENHTAAIMLLRKIFDIENASIREAKAERVDKQYYVDFDITKEEVRSGIKSAEEFNAKLRDFIDRLNTSTIDAYRAKATAILEKKQR